MDAQQFEVLSKKLDTIIALLALDKEKLAEKNKTGAILYLNELGLDNNTIALATGSTECVNDLRHEISEFSHASQ